MTCSDTRARGAEQLIPSAQGVGLVAMARHDPPPFQAVRLTEGERLWRRTSISTVACWSTSP